jgi:hypothetical protein
MKLHEVDKYGRLTPVPEGQIPEDKRWTARGTFVCLIPITMVIVFVYMLLGRNIGPVMRIERGQIG